MTVPAPPSGFTLNGPAPPPGFTLTTGEPAPEQRFSFAQRMGGRLFERQKVLEDIIGATMEGEQSTAEGLLQVAGKVGVGGLFDFLGEGLVSLGRGVSQVTPDVIEDRVVESATNVGRTFLNTDIGRLGLAAAQEGGTAYQEFAESNPRAARNIESVVNIGLLTAPVSRSARPGTITTAQERGLLERGAESLRGSATAQETTRRATFIEDLVLPKKTAKVRLEQTARTTEQGPLRSKEIALSPGEQRLAVELDAIPGVMETKTLQGNLNAIREELGVEADRLLTQLDRSPVRISNTEVRKSLELARRNLEEVPTIVGEAAKTADRLIENAMKFVADNPQTSAGLLKARQQFDSFLNAQKRNVLGDAGLENALSISAAEIRQTMNRLIQTKNPSAPVRASLNRQSNLFRAMDNVAPKAADEAASIVSRAWQNIEKVIGARGKFSQTMATIVGVGGLGAAALFAPAFTKIAGITGLGYFGGKAITSPAAKRALASLVERTDTAIKAATNQDMIRQLRADRALIIELLESDDGR